MNNQQYTPNPNIKLVLNGGEEILDSATVPVEWHFSEELIAQKPRYIILCDHKMSLEAFRKSISTSGGYRHSFAVKDLIGYIQIHKPGRHHFIAVVFYGDEERALEKTRSFLKKFTDSQYNVSVSYDEVERGESQLNTAIVAVEFEVPNELFAKKPETAFGRLVWSWANRWFKHAPVDECDYRRRKIFAFTLKPFLFLIGRLFFGIFGTLYTLIGASILLFIGYRPIPIFRNIKNAWIFLDNCKDDLFRFSRRYNWRVWNDQHPEKRMPVWAVPIFVILELGAIALVTLLVFKFLTSVILFIALILTFFIVVVVMVYKISARLKSKEWEQRQEEKERRDREQEEMLKNARENAYLAYLKKNISLDRVPGKVDIVSILRKVDTVTRFRLSYWGIKAKACRPYVK